MRRNRQSTHIALLVQCSMILFLLQVGCLVLDDEHCLANGGDLACPQQYCLLQTGAAAKTKSDDFGCGNRTDFVYHLRLPYGLPASFALGGGNKRMDTVQGILKGLWEQIGADDSCPLDSSELQDELDEIENVYADIYMIRARFEEGHVDTTRAKITTDEIDMVLNYNGAVREWLDACLAKAAEESSGAAP